MTETGRSGAAGPRRAIGARPPAHPQPPGIATIRSPRAASGSCWPRSTSAERTTDVRVMVIRASGPSFSSGYGILPDDIEPGDADPAVASRATCPPCWSSPPAGPGSGIAASRSSPRCTAAAWPAAPTWPSTATSSWPPTTPRIGFPPVRSMGVPPTNMWLYHLGPAVDQASALHRRHGQRRAEAASIGLVQAAVPAAELDGYVLSLARRIALVGRDLLAANKRVVNQGVELMGRSQLQALRRPQRRRRPPVPEARAFGPAGRRGRLAPGRGGAGCALRGDVPATPARRPTPLVFPRRMPRPYARRPWAYPLDVGGIDDYPVKVGSMLLTLVDPTKGFERAYNRWYERDHFYAGCMVGPWLFAGSRWVATRTAEGPALAGRAARSPGRPTPAATWPSTGWSKATTGEHFDEWSIRQVRDLYMPTAGDSPSAPTCTPRPSTTSARPIGTTTLSPSSSPSTTATTAFSSSGGTRPSGTGAELHETLAGGATRRDCSPARPSRSPPRGSPPLPDEVNRDAPMDLGSPAGGTDRLVQLLFVDGRLRGWPSNGCGPTPSDVESSGLATLLLAAPVRPHAWSEPTATWTSSEPASARQRGGPGVVSTDARRHGRR